MSLQIILPCELPVPLPALIMQTKMFLVTITMWPFQMPIEISIGAEGGVASSHRAANFLFVVLDMFPRESVSSF
jgi:hypothetical protein